ncbi:hypothetical protein [Kitasatospora brasiliensis]|uniref:hypothetical protein n=1 Tax=Kitasatospora brasiliensis TaxID=3058040 RepID=UPI002931263C|nr:hypothetical protein [Kitasatospora sp. K002]
MSNQPAHDPAAEARHARFGTLPERIRFEDMTEVSATTPGPAATAAYNPERAWTFHNCLAVDLAL